MNKTELVNAIAKAEGIEKKCAEKTARNPRTGEAITVAATKVPAFKAGAALKDKVSK